MLLKTVDNVKIKDILSDAKNKLPKSKSGFLIVLGIIGLFLILISTFSTDKNKKQEVIQSVSVNKGKTEEYTEAIENKLEEILSDMLSNTEVSVMVTLQSGVEYIYADETKTGVQTKSDRTSLKVEQSDTNQNNYVIFKDSDGNEQALLVTEKMPEIRGVVVVCEGGQTESVAVAVKTAISKALSVDWDKICVVGRF